MGVCIIHQQRAGEEKERDQAYVNNTQDNGRHTLREAFTTSASKVYMEVIGRKRALRQVQDA